MKTILITFALALAAIAVPAGEARAQFGRYYGGYRSFYPPVYSNYSPYAAFSGYTPYAFSPYVSSPGYLNYATPSYSYYADPYVWSGQYATTPFGNSYSYGRYYPYTNQYFYRYRTYPRYGW